MTRPVFGAPALTLLLFGVLFIVNLSASAADMTYIQDDVRFTGGSVDSFSEGGEQVTVVDGGFRLEAGKRYVTGKQAVMWIKEYKVASATRRDFIIYVRGNARITEPDGAATSDKAMLVTLHQQGRLYASGRPGKRLKVSNEPLEDDPLYDEALAVRQNSSVRRETLGSAPATASAPVSQMAIIPPASMPSTAPAKPKGPDTVTFRADRVSAAEQEKNQYAFVAHGNVYMTQGNAQSDLFLEMRSQSAVVFVEPVPIKTASAPYAPRLQGLPMGGENGGIAGVYLEGDVVISRGERMLRAKAAYYDFVNDRSYLLDPVLRTVQEQRNIPIYIRATEGRGLSASEFVFKNAKLTTSDFYTPEYHLGGSEVKFKDITAYDETGTRVSERSYNLEIKDATYNIGNVPFMYWPYYKTDVTENPIPLRSFSVGSLGNLGFGVQTEWDLFRLLGLLKPQGVAATFDFEAYAKGVVTGVNAKYARREGSRQYSGYDKFYYVLDTANEDRLGKDFLHVPAPENRGWALARHKELLPQDVELQLEISYLSDRNFLRAFFPHEFWAGKEQETLLYAKKQRDNWAVTSLLQTRINDFQTETESYPDIAFFLIGQPLLGDRLTYFNESRLGFVRWRPDDDSGLKESDIMGRADTRNELDWPLHIGPMKSINVVPYGVARGTAWSDTPDGSGEGRPYGQVGVKANTHIWRVYEDVDNRLFDLHGLKHTMTPQVAGFVSTDGGVGPDDLFPMTPGIETHLGELSAVSLGMYQRLQTKRGPEGSRYSVDWMRLDVVATIFNNNDIPAPPSDGRFFLSRPEYSIPRDAIDAEYTWNISDAFALLSDLNYDIESNGVGRADVGVAITRDPRLRYYFGWRYIRDLQSSVGTFGANYKINSKYSISAFEQYDFKFNNGANLASSVSLIRKFPRWYAAFTFSFDAPTDQVSVWITVWPEGIPEVRLSSQRVSLMGESSNN